VLESLTRLIIWFPRVRFPPPAIADQHGGAERCAMTWNAEYKSEVVSAAAAVVSTADAKEFLGLDSGFTADDTLIASAVSAATEWAEAETGRQIGQATFDIFLDEFPDTILVPHVPLQSVTSIKYIDDDGTQQTLSSAIYTVDAKDNRQAARIVPAYDQVWPATRTQPNAVEIRIVCGYATVPDLLLSAIKQYAREFYDYGHPDLERLNVWLTTYRVHRW